MKKILVVGQTPPPFGGQALMIRYMLENSGETIKYYHARMAFSKEFNDRGKFSFYKTIHLFEIIIAIYKLRIKHNIKYLYYPPSNSPKVAVYRDFIILLFTRFLFTKTIFHFHAAGLCEVLPKYPLLSRKLIYRMLKKPDLSITSSEFNPEDGRFLQAKTNVVIPLGIPELIAASVEKRYNNNIKLLFVGLLNSTKGERYILDAMYNLKQEGVNVNLSLAGKFESDSYKKEILKKHQNQLMAR